MRKTSAAAEREGWEMPTPLTERAGEGSLATAAARLSRPPLGCSRLPSACDAHRAMQRRETGREREWSSEALR